MYKKCFIINIKYSHHTLDTIAFGEFSKDRFIQKNFRKLDGGMDGVKLLVLFFATRKCSVRTMNSTEKFIKEKI